MIDFGVHGPNSTFIGHFDYEGNLRAKEIRTTCGCTATNIDGNKLRVEVTVAPLIGATRRTKQKTITVIEHDNTVTELVVRYTVDMNYRKAIP